MEGRAAPPSTPKATSTKETDACLDASFVGRITFDEPVRGTNEQTATTPTLLGCPHTNRPVAFFFLENLAFSSVMNCCFLRVVRVRERRRAAAATRNDLFRAPLRRRGEEGAGPCRSPPGFPRSFSWLAKHGACQTHRGSIQEEVRPLRLPSIPPHKRPGLKTEGLPQVQ